MHRYSASFLAIVVFSVTFGLGCSTEDERISDESAKSNQENGETDDETASYRLPSMNEYQTADCFADDDLYPDEYLQPETFTDWASGTTKVVVGTVTDVQPVFSPAFYQNYPDHMLYGDAESCDRVRIAVDVVVEDLDVLVGADAERVTFRVGHHQIREQFLQFPRLDDDGGIIWMEYNAESGESEPSDRGIFEGMRIGARLYQSSRAAEFESIPGDLLTTARTWLFEVEDDDTILFQGHDGRPSYCPGEIGYYQRPEDDVTDGVVLEELAANLPDNLTGDIAESNRRYVEKLSEIESDELHAFRLGTTAGCQIDEEPEDDDLHCMPGADDCPNGEVCIDGLCEKDQS